MKINRDEVHALSKHLLAEIDCLEQLLDILAQEGSALRRMAVTELDEIASAKENVVNRQAQLSRLRNDYLTSHSTGEDRLTFSQIIAQKALSETDEFVQNVKRLRSLGMEVQRGNELNRAFAKMGQGLVSALVRIVDTSRSPTAQTYASNGHIRSSVLDLVPKGVRACSV